MSLLNDALRDLEKREGADEGAGPSVPAGLSAAGYDTPGYWRWLLGGAALLLAVAAGLAFWWFSGNGSQSAGEGPLPALEPAPSPVVRTVTTGGASEDADNTPAPRESDSGEPPETVAAVVVPLEKAVGEGSRPEPSTAEEQPEEQPEVARTPDHPETASPDPSSEDKGEASQEPEARQETATVRELTPAEQDRRLAQALEELLADGRVNAAAERLRQRVMLDSDAPRSRAVMARHALSREDPEAARQWLPEGAVAMYPELRLLRARIALTTEGRASALEWLETNPPGPDTLPPYHAMMAALYQQRGEHESAASQWAALIETDDGNARWWAGLGMAMEGRGRDERARTAYSRALSLPDLAPQLRRYIEKRLASEQG